MSIMKSEKSKTDNRPVAIKIISGAVAGLNGDPSFDSKSVTTGVILALRAVAIEMEKQGFASKGDTERCFKIINIIEREG